MGICVKIKRAYRKNNIFLNDINFDSENGKITAIIGKNGSGKSTLVSAICQFIKYDGEIFANGNLLSALNERDRAKLISVIFQNLKSPHITVGDLVALGRSPYQSLYGKLNKTDEDIIKKSILDANLSDIEDKYLDEISGGELKRAYFGLMLSQNTDNIILDEATAFMDRDYEKTFLELIKSIVKHNDKCCITVMHNLENAVRYADNVLLLENGNQLFFGTKDELLSTDLIEKTFSLKRVCSDNNIFFV